jgi:hypothetical protein
MSASLRAALVTATLAMASGMTATESLAQGFFQNLFGFGGGASSPNAPPRMTSPPAQDYRYREPAAPPSRSVAGDAQPVEKGGKYRTMCVRMCDGYYFPVSASVSRRDFYRDARICKKSCGTEAVLFYHASSSGDASTMIDLTGRAYARLPNALRYRKQLVDGCKCRPEPWSASEIARHHRYAMEAAREAAEPPAQVAKASIAAESRAVTDGNESTKPSQLPLAVTVTPIIQEISEERVTASSTEPTPVPVIARVAKVPAKSSPSRRASTPRAESTVRLKPPVTRSAAQPLKPAPSGLGLGNQKLRWPGD